MSTAAQVRSAWNSKIWTNANITALTTKIYAFDMVTMATISKKHDRKLREAREYNFIQYRVSKARKYEMTGQIVYEYPVTIQYFRQADIDGGNFNAIEDAFETIFTYVRSELDDNWNSTVDYYRTQEERPDISEFIINDEPCWMGQYEYTGYKVVTL